MRCTGNLCSRRALSSPPGKSESADHKRLQNTAVLFRPPPRRPPPLRRPPSFAAASRKIEHRVAEFFRTADADILAGAVSRGRIYGTSGKVVERERADRHEIRPGKQMSTEGVAREGERMIIYRVYVIVMRQNIISRAGFLATETTSRELTDVICAHRYTSLRDLFTPKTSSICKGSCGRTSICITCLLLAHCDGGNDRKQASITGVDGKQRMAFVRDELRIHP